MQTLKPQHIVIDGNSGPPWTDRIKSVIDTKTKFVSEDDDGIYDGLNKGIRLSDGLIIGILHSDDEFANKDVLRSIEKAFRETNADVVYGDLKYVNKWGKTIRSWKAGEFTKRKLSFGWMPPHPTVFVRRDVFDRVGYYDATYRIAGDYEFLLRLFGTEGIKVHYLPIDITIMRLGGASNKNLYHIFQKMREDVRSMRRHGIKPWLALPSKNIQKLGQFIGFFGNRRSKPEANRL